jgi:hypothetical protein
MYAASVMTDNWLLNQCAFVTGTFFSEHSVGYRAYFFPIFVAAAIDIYAKKHSTEEK